MKIIQYHGTDKPTANHNSAEEEGGQTNLQGYTYDLGRVGHEQIHLYNLQVELGGQDVANR